MTSPTMEATTVSGRSVAPTVVRAPSPIRPVFGMRSSAPISAELYTSTTDPNVIAFQATAAFHDTRDGSLTLEALQQRWGTSRREAAGARQTLIALGYWVEVRVRVARGRFRTETRTAEVRLSEADLALLSADYPPSSLLVCGGHQYIIEDDGIRRSDRVTTSGNPVDGTGIPPVVTRSDQAEPGTGIPPAVTRSDQAEHPVTAGRTGIPPAVTPHASSVRSTDDEKTCMHDAFWAMITTQGTPVDPPGQAAVRAQLDVAFTAGWSPAALAAWVARQVDSSRRPVSNRAGFTIAQLRSIPVVAEPEPAGPPPTLPPACESCLTDMPAARLDVKWRRRRDPKTGLALIDPETGQPVLCDCHPQSGSA